MSIQDAARGAVFYLFEKVVPWTCPINLQCSSLTVSKGGSVQKNIKFTVISTTAFQAPAVVINTLQAVNFLNTSTQIFLGVSPVPVSASMIAYQS